MKVMHIQLLPKMSGAQQVSYDLMKGLPSHWEKYIVFAAPIPADIERKFSDIGVESIALDGFRHEISPLNDLKIFLKILKVIRDYKPEILHTHSTKPGVLGRVAAGFAGVEQIVHTVHGIAFHNKESFLKRGVYLGIEWVASLFGHKIVSVNNYYKKYYRYFPGSLEVIYNGVAEVEICSHEGRVLTVGFIGRFDEQKNPQFVIELAKAFKGESVQFLMAGDGSLMADCQRLIEKNELHNVKLLGWIEDKAEFYSGISVLLQPSRWEAFGLTVAEAASAGVPALVSDVEGLPEVVCGSELQIFREGDLKACEAKLRRMIFDAEVLEECSSVAYRNYCEYFTVERMQLEYINLYLSK